MKTIDFLSTAAGVILNMLLFSSCETESLAPSLEDNSQALPHKALMRLVGDAPSYSPSAKADGTEREWADKSKVYLQFSVGDALVSGSATYDLLEDIWTVEYAGTLQTVASATCQAYYFENSGEATFEEVSMTENTAVFIDSEASYSFSLEDNLIVLKAHLKPYLSRVRLEGNAGQVFHFDGPLHYTAYNMAANAFVSSGKMISGEVDEKGGTGYYYLYFKDGAERQIRFYDYVNGDKFTRTFPDNVFTMGKSGYLNVPTADSYSGFIAEELLIHEVNVSGVTFNMVYVEPGTFSMGSTSTQEEQPVHEVTISKPYYIGETEVTQELWIQIIGNNPSYSKGNKLPVSGVSWNDCQTFIQKLNEVTESKIITGMTFGLPTEAEWEFAAKGGNLSKGYIYSGSDVIGDVAWWTSNTHPYYYKDVKTKDPNELGIYDMSGNVYEWCQDWYGDYKEFAVTDPTGPSNGTAYVIRGGAYCTNSNLCTCTYRSSSNPDDRHTKLGLRLVLKP
ncbi:MAG: SUMF1/EgtB/PvdO family nonheme iron enzyme [Bacteroidales bacterium]|nr:SUMF1/EgtB/PvdO family nonheme iron enzyme [Bacteroidales bacterium]